MSLTHDLVSPGKILKALEKGVVNNMSEWYFCSLLLAMYMND